VEKNINKAIYWFTLAKVNEHKHTHFQLTDSAKVKLQNQNIELFNAYFPWNEEVILPINIDFQNFLPFLDVEYGANENNEHPLLNN
ncbi:21950_t:CDS:1, partial [Dentiscutata erythropus]